MTGNGDGCEHDQQDPPYITRTMIEDGLRDLGLAEGDIVMAHSSLSSFGYVEGGADAVIDALLTVIGPTGTLCMPTLTYGDYTPDNPPPLFDPQTTKGIVGKIPETFRQRPGVKRSLHPTHSIAAFGPQAEVLIKDHEYSRTPSGPHSPWGKIRDLGGWVLMAGCGMLPMTMSHGPEEVFHEDARCTPPVRCRIKRIAGEIEEVSIRLHQPYSRPGPDRSNLEAALEEEGALRRTEVGNSTLLLTRASSVWEVFSRWCRQYQGSAIVDCRKENENRRERREH